MRLISFNLPNPSSRIMALESTQPLTEISTRDLPGGKGRPARKANFIAICDEPMSRNFGNFDVLQPYGPSRHVTGLALLFFFTQLLLDFPSSRFARKVYPNRVTYPAHWEIFHFAVLTTIDELNNLQVSRC
jgi:hypothetical protein